MIRLQPYMRGGATLITVVVVLLMTGFAFGYPSRGAAAQRHSVQTDMGPIMILLDRHDKIRFAIRNIPGGVITITTSSDREVVKTIRLHASEMKARMEQGNTIRPNDPLFAELFRRHSSIVALLRDIPHGVVEQETSRKPQVVLLIRAHARAVAEFVREGLPRARRNTPVPQGYRNPSPLTPHP